MAIKLVHMYFIPYHITILYSIFNSNELINYLFGSPAKTVYFFLDVYD